MPELRLLAPAIVRRPLDLVHGDVQWALLEEPRHRYVGADLELPPKHINDLRHAPEAHRVRVLQADVPESLVQDLVVIGESHLVALEVQAVGVADVLEPPVERGRLPALRRDDDLVPAGHPRDEVRELRIRFQGFLLPVAPSHVQVVRSHQCHTSPFHDLRVPRNGLIVVEVAEHDADEHVTLGHPLELPLDPHLPIALAPVEVLRVWVLRAVTLRGVLRRRPHEGDHLPHEAIRLDGDALPRIWRHMHSLLHPPWTPARCSANAD
mmetsp:Transcript_71081/g.179416  ORF Transcript_71081/g.179416 Transcript_71081/m.179416 type:complete len:266 (+) Transcript_71081:538-1335(+)